MRDRALSELSDMVSSYFVKMRADSPVSRILRELDDAITNAERDGRTREEYYMQGISDGINVMLKRTQKKPKKQRITSPRLTEPPPTQQELKREEVAYTPQTEPLKEEREPEIENGKPVALEQRLVTNHANNHHSGRREKQSGRFTEGQAIMYWSKYDGEKDITHEQYRARLSEAQSELGRQRIGGRVTFDAQKVRDFVASYTPPSIPPQVTDDTTQHKKQLVPQGEEYALLSVVGKELGHSTMEIYRLCQYGGIELKKMAGEHFVNREDIPRIKDALS